MRYQKIALLTISAFVLLTAGCASKLSDQDQDRLIFTGVSDKTILLDTSKQVLQEMGFTIEKADYNANIIRTRPLAGAGLLEFWRKNNATTKDLMYSSIHSIQKIVQIELEQDKRLSCIVQTQRLSLPPRTITGFDDLPATFSNSSSSRQRLSLDDKYQEKMTWVYDGTDENLQHYILKKIQKRLKKQQEK